MPSNPYKGERKAVPPPVPPNKARRDRLGLDTFIYNCHQCGKERSHSCGYLFVVMLGTWWLYFCGVNCCDDWEKANPELKDQTPPVPDRRGAILATREKNEEADFARKT